MEKTTVKSLLFSCKHKTCFWKLGNFKRGGANVCVVGYLSGQAGLSFSRLVLVVLKKLNLCSSARSLHLPFTSLSPPITCHLFHAPWGYRVITTRLQKIDLVLLQKLPLKVYLNWLNSWDRKDWIWGPQSLLLWTICTEFLQTGFLCLRANQIIMPSTSLVFSPSFIATICTMFPNPFWVIVVCYKESQSADCWVRAQVNTVLQLALIGSALMQPALDVVDTYSIVPILR